MDNNNLQITQMKEKEEALITIINSCPEILETIDACNAYGLKDFYLAGGAITQSLWNSLIGNFRLANIKDFDIVYFSSEEDRNQSKHHQSNLENLVQHKMDLDVVNQAYVHEWYGKKFGNQISPFTRTEDGICTWLPAFAIGITREEHQLKIFAPYGLDDAFNMLVRPNKLTMNKDNYLKMTKSFKHRWNEIEVLPWEE